MKKWVLFLAAVSVPAMAQAQTGIQPKVLSAEDVTAWIKQADTALFDQSVKAARAEWVYNTYITPDTEKIAADADAEMMRLQAKVAKEAAERNSVPGLSAEVRRQLSMLRTKIALPAQSDTANEIAEISARMQGRYAQGTGTLRGQPIGGNDIEAEMGLNRNPAELQEMWTSWHDNVGAPMKDDYAKLVTLANAGARELGFADTGALWRSNYDMEPDAFAALADKIWDEVRPLYEQLHCYTRTRLSARYGAEVQPETGPIRADLLGNMWAQEWGNIYDVVAPASLTAPGYDIGELLAGKGYDPLKMVKAGENFFSSVGFAPLPDTFWQRSQFVKPRDRDVVCHASAWDIDNKDDLRIKMCIRVNTDDFVTIHHELGHTYYQRAYNDQPYFMYMDSANDGFHEAIGDTIALAITPEYLVKIGLMERSAIPPASADTGLLLRQALDKVAFLPFGLLIDQWRWKVFSGEVTPDNYEKAWNDLRLYYQGIVPPTPRGDDAFSPGAKFHVPSSVPYVRYFLARVLQFQFFEAACKQAGWKGPLHRCTFYGDKKVGKKLDAMLAMGAQKPWPDALQEFTGSREISGKALLSYFKPLSQWLEQQNKNTQCGW